MTHAKSLKSQKLNAQINKTNPNRVNFALKELRKMVRTSKENIKNAGTDKFNSCGNNSSFDTWYS